MSDLVRLHRAFAHARAVLFDFDGPLCDVFAGYPASVVARELDGLVGQPHATEDPLEVLKLSADQSSEILMRTENALVAAEVTAVRQGVATPGGVAAIRKALTVGCRVGVVSNNSAQAVLEFLSMHQLGESSVTVVGRAPGKPWLMKPNPWPIQEALRQIECAPEAAVFVGDSATDIEAAVAANVSCVAYANKPGKLDEFRSSGAIVIDDMGQIETALDASQHTPRPL